MCGEKKAGLIAGLNGIYLILVKISPIPRKKGLGKHDLTPELCHQLLALLNKARRTRFTRFEWDLSNFG